MPKGSCLCGAVTFEVHQPLKPPDACHCTACRKSSGHYFVSTDLPREQLTVVGEEHVCWYASSEKVRRGFCGTCGSTLFWDPIHHDWTAVAMGAFDEPTGVAEHVHIFAASKGDYYALPEGVPAYDEVPPQPASAGADEE